MWAEGHPARHQPGPKELGGGGARAGGDGRMGTGAPGARQEPGLKERVAACGGEEMAAWLERAAPPRSGRATPVRRVVGAIAWHLRVGGPWRALPAGWPPWRTVY